MDQTHQITGRAAYAAARARARNVADCRTDRGLPHHPNGSGFAPCPHCAGAGQVVVNDTNPHGFGPDPQCDEEVDCPKCDGYGEVPDGRSVDPILLMREARLQSRRGPVSKMLYGRALVRAYSPVCLPETMLVPARFRWAA